MYRAVLLDLYDTVVKFHNRVPTVDVAGAPRRSTMAWMAAALAQELPGVTPEEFLAAMNETTAEIVRDRPPDYFEVSSRERFRRALTRLRVSESERGAKAERLSCVHMGHLAESTELPSSHRELLRALAARYALALVSNFDHGPTAREVLARHDLESFFRSVLISDEFGRRKPHPSIFQQALRTLGVTAPDAIFVGDSASDDVAGARAAGIDVVWINPAQSPLPEGVPAPTRTVTALVEIAPLLGVSL